MFGIPIISGLVFTLTGKVKKRVVEKGMAIMARELVEAPKDLIDTKGMEHGLMLSQAMKKVRLGVAEDWVRDRIVQYAAALARGIDSDD